MCPDQQHMHSMCDRRASVPEVPQFSKLPDVYTEELNYWPLAMLPSFGEVEILNRALIYVYYCPQLGAVGDDTSVSDINHILAKVTVGCVPVSSLTGTDRCWQLSLDSIQSDSSLLSVHCEACSWISIDMHLP